MLLAELISSLSLKILKKFSAVWEIIVALEKQRKFVISLYSDKKL